MRGAVGGLYPFVTNIGNGTFSLESGTETSAGTEGGVIVYQLRLLIILL